MKEILFLYNEETSSIQLSFTVTNDTVKGNGKVILHFFPLDSIPRYPRCVAQNQSSSISQAVVSPLPLLHHSPLPSQRDKRNRSILSRASRQPSVLCAGKRVDASSVPYQTMASESSSGVSFDLLGRSQTLCSAPLSRINLFEGEGERSQQRVLNEGVVSVDGLSQGVNGMNEKGVNGLNEKGVNGLSQGVNGMNEKGVNEQGVNGLSQGVNGLSQGVNEQRVNGLSQGMSNISEKRMSSVKQSMKSVRQDINTMNQHNLISMNPQSSLMDQQVVPTKELLNHEYQPKPLPLPNQLQQLIPDSYLQSQQSFRNSSLPYNPSTQSSLPYNQSTQSSLPSNPSTHSSLPSNPSTHSSLPSNPSTHSSLPHNPLPPTTPLNPSPLPLNPSQPPQADPLAALFSSVTPSTVNFNYASSTTQPLPYHPCIPEVSNMDEEDSDSAFTHDDPSGSDDEWCFQRVAKEQPVSQSSSLPTSSFQEPSSLDSHDSLRKRGNLEPSSQKDVLSHASISGSLTSKTISKSRIHCSFLFPRYPRFYYPITILVIHYHNSSSLSSSENALLSILRVSSDHLQ